MCVYMDKKNFIKNTCVQVQVHNYCRTKKALFIWGVQYWSNRRLLSGTDQPISTKWKHEDRRRNRRCFTPAFQNKSLKLCILRGVQLIEKELKCVSANVSLILFQFNLVCELTFLKHSKHFILSARIDDITGACPITADLWVGTGGTVAQVTKGSALCCQTCRQTEAARHLLLTDAPQRVSLSSPPQTCSSYGATRSHLCAITSVCFCCAFGLKRPVLLLFPGGLSLLLLLLLSSWIDWTRGAWSPGA